MIMSSITCFFMRMWLNFDLCSFGFVHSNCFCILFVFKGIWLPKILCGRTYKNLNQLFMQAIAAMLRAQEADPTNLEVLLALGVSHTNG